MDGIGFIGGIILYWVAVYYGLPLLGLLLKFLAIAFWEALRFVCKGLLWIVVLIGKGLLWIVVHIGKGMIWVCVQAGRGIHLAILLLYFVIIEALRGPAFEDEGHEEDEEEEYEEDSAPSETAYEAALNLFGLKPGFSQTEFKRAYIAAIKLAHPDKGGSARAAQAINASRDLVMSWNRWA